MREKIPVIVALIASVINAYLAGESYGFERGLEFAAAYKESAGTHFYDGNNYLGETHLFLALCFVGFVIGRWLLGEVSHLIASILSLVLASFVYIRWIGLMVLNNERAFVSNLQQGTRELDWLSFFLFLFLIGELVIGVLSSVYLKNKGR